MMNCAVTMNRTWVTSDTVSGEGTTTRSTNHYTITAFLVVWVDGESSFIIGLICQFVHNNALSGVSVLQYAAVHLTDLRLQVGMLRVRVNS